MSIAAVLLPGVALAGTVAALLLAWRLHLRLAGARSHLAAAHHAQGHTGIELARHQALYRLVSEDAGCAVLRLDSARQPIDASAGSRQVLGIDAHELLADATLAAVYPDDRPLLHAALLDCHAQRPARHTVCRLRHADGRLTWVDMRCRYVAEDDSLIVVMRDVSERRLLAEHLGEARSRLERLALHDPLTGLFNRAGFLAAADRLLASAQLLAVLFINLDRFKAMNDVHGHGIGDAVLREVGQRLTRVLGHDTTIARLNGDEFAAALPVAEGDLELAARARDIIRSIGDPIRVAGMSLDIGATIGIAVSPRDGRNAIAMLRAADIALAYGKSAGGGCYRFFEPRMADALAQETELKNELRAAISAGQIVPYFQPLVSLREATIAGFEVLARWEHPARGVLPPAVFLPLIEDLGLSTDMFTMLLAKICVLTQGWPAHVRLAVNISPRELQDETLPDTVRGILENAGFDGSRLEIEITENALVHDSKVARGVINGLRALGMTMSLDDFGTGYSSLYHLRELPFDKVKIDKSFMRALDSDADSARYVAAIIGLCHALGLLMTAEGIEDEATMRRLRELGCIYGQGYLFGRPAPAAEATRVLTENSWPALAAE